MAQERTIVKEFNPTWAGKYRVERQYNGWDWRHESTWETKAAAYYAAESLAQLTDDNTRVTL